MWTIVTTILTTIFKGLFGWLTDEKKNQLRSERDAAQEALKTVGTSLDTESKIREAQKGEVVKDPESEPDYDAWNNNKKE